MRRRAATPYQPCDTCNCCVCVPQAECAVVNFAVTEGGLEEQLLAAVVEHERPDLAAQRLSLIAQQNKDKVSCNTIGTLGPCMLQPYRPSCLAFPPSTGGAEVLGRHNSC